MIGPFERSVGGIFIYKITRGYLLYRAQGMELLSIQPRSFNVWQNSGQLKIWFLANGFI